MSWIRDSSVTWFQRLAIQIIKSGRVPKHVAFIMDGNRRYANKTHVKNLDGHNKGFDKLTETLQWCLDLEIPEVTVYAFSIENLNRSKEEVDGLMEMAKEKFQKLLDERDKLAEHGVRVRMIGNLSLVSNELRKLALEIAQVTKHNSKLFLNIAFTYTSRDEITQVVKDIAKGVKDAEITVEDIDESLVSNCLYTHESPEPGLLIRSSGEVRYSDFLLWQSSQTCVYFVNRLWPEFCVWDLLAAVFYYQRCYNDTRKASKDCKNYVSILNNRTDTYVSKLHKEREVLLGKM